MSIKKVSKTDKEALQLIAELGLKDKPRLSEDDLLTIAKALYRTDYQNKLEPLLNSKYLKA